MAIDALYRISSLINNTEDPKEALACILEEIMKVLPAASASINLINPDTKLLEIEVMRGIPTHSKQVQLQLGQGVTGWVALHGKPLIVEDVTLDQRYIPVKESIRSEMAVPMEDQGVIIGVVNVDSEKIGAFNEQDKKILTLLTHEATRVTNKLWMIRRLKEKASQLHGLVDAGRILVAKRERNEVFESICTQGCTVMGAHMCALFLNDPKTKRLELKALIDSKGGKHSVQESIQPEESSIGTAFERQKLVEVIDIRRTEENHFTKLIQKERLVSMLTSPIIIDGKAVGVINVYTQKMHRFNNEERQIFNTFSSLSALAIHNGELYDRVFSTEETMRRNERLNMLGLLSAEIAHEIRNPLTVIKLLFDSLDLNFPEEDMRQQDVTIIFEKLNQLESIVSRVLSFGKSTGNLHSRWDLNKLVEDTIHLVRLKLTQSGIKLSFIKHESALNVDVNKGQLQQVILNLIMNALHAMKKGGALEISTSTCMKDGLPHAACRVKDTGHGFASEIAERAFESFLTGSPEGTGLGLSIVKNIMSNHHGTVEIEKTSPEGTTMCFTLPILDTK